MLKKLQDKKGFSLVELMIVVVIMGILVAVAIPIYNSATKNAKVKSCNANMRVIEENLSSYIMTGNNGGEFSYTQIIAADPGFGAQSVELTMGTDGKTPTGWPATFLATFKDPAALKCPFSGGTYTISFAQAGDGGVNFAVKCNDTTHAAKDAESVGKELPAA